MSRETLAWLNTQTLIGFTDQRGYQWHHRAELQGEEPNHYAGAIPVADVERRLFSWQAVPRKVAVELPATFETMDHLDDMGQPARWEFLPDRQAITRSDNDHVMGLFKAGYVPHQYAEWLLNTVSNILGDTLFIASAGLLREGAVAWVSVEVPDTIKTPEGVAFRPQLLACTSFDGSLATTFKRVVTNVVCDNTMAMALSEKGQQYKVKHSRNSGVRLNEAREALAIVHDTADVFAAEVKRLCETTVTPAQWSRFLDLYAPLEKDGQRLTGRALTMADTKRGDLNRMYRHDRRAADWQGTAWGVIQAVSTYSHHVQTVRGTERAERNMTRAVNGEAEQADREAYALLSAALA